MHTTYIHVYIHTCTHAYAHIKINICTYIHTYSKHIHTCTYTNIHINTHTSKCTPSRNSPIARLQVPESYKDRYNGQPPYNTTIHNNGYVTDQFDLFTLQYHWSSNTAKILSHGIACSSKGIRGDVDVHG